MISIDQLNIAASYTRQLREVLLLTNPLLIDKEVVTDNERIQGTCSFLGIKELKVLIEKDPSESIAIRVTLSKTDDGNFKIPGIDLLEFSGISEPIIITIPKNQKTGFPIIEQGQLTCSKPFQGNFKVFLKADAGRSFTGGYAWELAIEIAELNLNVPALLPASSDINEVIKKIRGIGAQVIQKVGIILGNRKSALIFYAPNSFTWNVFNNVNIGDIELYISAYNSTLFSANKELYVQATIKDGQEPKLDVRIGFDKPENEVILYLALHAYGENGLGIADILGNQTMEDLSAVAPQAWVEKISTTSLLSLGIEFYSVQKSITFQGSGYFLGARTAVDVAFVKFLGKYQLQFSATVDKDPKSIQEVLSEMTGESLDSGMVSWMPEIKTSLQKISYDQFSGTFGLAGRMVFGKIEPIDIIGNVAVRWKGNVAIKVSVYPYEGTISIQQILNNLGLDLTAIKNVLPVKMVDKIGKTAFKSLGFGFDKNSKKIAFSGGVVMFDTWEVDFDFRSLEIGGKRFSSFSIIIQDLDLSFRELINKVGIDTMASDWESIIPNISIAPRQIAFDQQGNTLLLDIGTTIGRSKIDLLLEILNESDKRVVHFSVISPVTAPLSLTSFIEALLPKVDLSDFASKFNVFLEQIDYKKELKEVDGNFSALFKGYLVITNARINLTTKTKDDNGNFWVFMGASEPGQSIKIGELIQELADKFGADNKIPEAIATSEITEISLVYDTETKNMEFILASSFDFQEQETDIAIKVSIDNQEGEGKVKQKKLSFSGEFIYKQDINDPSKDIDCVVAFTKKEKTYKAEFSLKFPIVSRVIVLNGSFGKNNEGESEARFAGGSGNLDLNLTQMLDDLLEGQGYELPEGLLPDLSITKVYIAFLKEANKKTINLYAESVIARKKIEASSGNTDQPKDVTIKFFFQNISGAEEPTQNGATFGLRTDLADLSGMPLVGDQLKDVKLSNLGIIYTTITPLPSKVSIPTGVNMPADGQQGIKKITTTDKEQELTKKLSLSGEISYSNTKEPFPMALPVPVSSAPSTSQTKGPQADPSEKWFQFDKKLGPVTVGGLGFSYKEKILTLLFKGDFSLGGLTVSLQGLGLGFEPTKLLKGELEVPTFSLNGLGLSYVKDPINISGAFIRTQEPNTKISFAGAAVIKVSKFSITGLGGYAEMNTGESSLFLYALLEMPIGGPAFFFVTGIAVGFGYNRSVRIPGIKDVNKFPLVSVALSKETKTMADILSDLTAEPPWIPPSVGDYWLAIGIKFTSFKLFESFILVIVEFGSRLAFSILGLSVLKWPDDTFGPDVKPIIYVELALKITFGPGSDVIAVEAAITSNSYVLFEGVRLTGGFAFYVWISGENEGDFVITLGGYHPKYRKPKHYPDVDRLGLYVKIPGFPVTLRGELYFALTPSAIMAGGRWEVLFDIGFLKAYLIIWADILIQWAPFYYNLQAGVRIGIEAKILFIRFSLEMGAVLRIWGPPFAGEIFVDWKIFSFTVPLGKGGKEVPPPISWEEFQDSLIPKVKEKSQPLEARIQDGIIDVIRDKEDKEKIKATIVDPYNVVLAVDSFFPLKEVYTQQPGQTNTALVSDTLVSLSNSDMPGLYEAVKNKSFGIKPMRVTDLDTSFYVWLEKGGTPVTENIAFMGTAKGVPTALWSNHLGNEEVDPNKKNDPNTDEPQVIDSVLSGLELHATEPKDDKILELSLNEYAQYTEDAEASFYVNNPAGYSSPGEIQQEIATQINNLRQDEIYDNLKELGFDLDKRDGSLDFTDLNVRTPLFLASIGQKIAKKTTG